MLLHILKEKCPSCHQGQVFDERNSWSLIKMPKMNRNCLHCDHRFEKEPGFFFGAMFVSYGLCIIESALAFLLYLILPVSEEYLIYFLLLPILLFWPFNFRKSRLVWMHLV